MKIETRSLGCQPETNMRSEENKQHREKPMNRITFLLRRCSRSVSVLALVAGIAALASAEARRLKWYQQ